MTMVEVAILVMAAATLAVTFNELFSVLGKGKRMGTRLGVDRVFVS